MVNIHMPLFREEEMLLWRNKMIDNVMYKLLNLVDTKASIGELFKLGYSYSSIVSWYFELEQKGYIHDESDDYRTLTTAGKRKLAELKSKKNIDMIGKLEQYRVEKNQLKIYIYLDIIEIA